jgi:hypothetical protein
MKQWLNKSNKTWLISLVLLICLSSVSAGLSSHSVAHSKQTEVTVRASSINATPLFASTLLNKIVYYAGDLCSSTRITTHSQHAILRLKNSRWNIVSRSSSLGHAHLKKLNTKEDTVLLKS